MTTSYPRIGRRAYGVAAIVLGASCLVWRNFAAPWHPLRPGVPYRPLLACVAGIALVAGGLGVQWQRTARAALIGLGALFLIGALLWMPRVVGYPRLFGVWNGTAEELAMVAAALLVLAAARVPAGRWTPGMRAARVLFGMCSTSFGIEHFTAIPQTASMVPAWLPPGQTFWAVATGAAMLLAGLALISGLMATSAAWCLTTLFLTYEAVIWIPRVIADPHHQIPWAGSAMNLAVAASACMVAETLSRQRSMAPRADR